jgi:hypothetical protein
VAAEFGEMAQANIRTADGTVIPCLCPSVGYTRANSELGISRTPTFQIRVTGESLPTVGMTEGSIITLIESDGTEHKLRIASIPNTMGFVTITVEAVNG